MLAAASALVALASGSAHAQDAGARAPFITTPDEVVARMLTLAGTSPADYVVDLGSGDGRIVIAAARLHGARGLGVDLNDALVRASRQNAERAGVADLVQFEVRDVFEIDLSRATVVTFYLLPSLVDRLQPKLLEELRPGARIVSHAFPMKGWRPDRAERMRISGPHPGQGDESAIFLWIVPAQVRGEWSGADWSLRVQQNFQDVEIEAVAAGRQVPIVRARLEGDLISFSGDGFAYRGRVQGEAIAGELTRDGRASPFAFLRKK
jgi:protein-L-isoaspartate O-methyltransferase